MPRKSSFKNKVKVEEPVEEPEQQVEEPVKKIALKKKERKQRKKRSKKVVKEETKPEEKPEEKLEEKPEENDVSFSSDIIADSTLADFSYEAKSVKKVKKSMLSKLASKVSPFAKKEKIPEPKQEETYEEIIDVSDDEPVKSDKPTKDSIMAKLAALQASRSIVIEPIAKPTPTPIVEPILKLIPMMKELVITSDEKKIEQLKEKLVPKSENKKVIDQSKTYKLYIDLEQEDDVCHVDFNNDRRTDLTLYRMSFNKNKKTLNCSYFCGEKWTIGKRIRLKDLKNTITFKPSVHIMYLQVRGVVSGPVKRRNPGLGINVATWNCKTLKIV